jgi:hypothetical protein
MTRSFYAIPAMICLAAATVLAQAPAGDRPTSNPPATQQPTTQKPATSEPAAQQPSRPAESSSASAGKVTYVGCVKPGTSSGSWVLENAELAPKAGASSSSTVGTSGTSKMVLNLSPAATVNLTPHANHKVEVVGVASPAKPGADSAASTPGASTAAGAQASRQQFSVESVKMVSATCP